MKTSKSLLIVFCITVLDLSGCGGGTGGSPTPAGGSTPGGLTVASVTPVANASGVARGISITATFSSALDCGSVISSSITVTNAQGTAVAGTVSCSGTKAMFTPGATLAAQKVYTVSISGTIKDGSGNALTGNYSWSFTTKAEGWATAAALNSSLTATQSSSPYLLGKDTQGYARVMYRVWDASTNSMASSSYSPGVGWTSPFSMGGPVFGSGAVIKANAKGEAVAFWRENDNQFYAKVYTQASGWSQTTRVSDPAAGSISLSFNNWDVAIDGNGNAIAVWSQQLTLGVNGTIVYASRYTPSGGWGAPVLVGSGTDSRYPKIGMDESGNGIALWSENTGNINYRIRSKYFNIGALAWGAMEEVSGATTYFAGSPQIGFDGSGNAITVWEQTDGTWNNYPNPAHERYSVYANRYVPGTGWGTAVKFGRDSLGDSTEAKLAVAANGKAVAIWRFKRDASNFSHYFNIAAAHFDGSNWTMGNAPLLWDVVAGETGIGYQADTQGANVTIDANGRETLVWYRAIDSTNYSIYSTNYTSAGGWLTATTLSTTTYAYPAPLVQADDSGMVTAVWTQSEGARTVMMSNQND